MGAQLGQRRRLIPCEPYRPIQVPPPPPKVQSAGDEFQLCAFIKMGGACSFLDLVATALLVTAQAVFAVVRFRTCAIWAMVPLAN